MTFTTEASLWSIDLHDFFTKFTGRAKQIEYVDMRYGNGFTIGWKSGSQTPVSDPERAEQEMLAARGLN